MSTSLSNTKEGFNKLRNRLKKEEWKGKLFVEHQKEFAYKYAEKLKEIVQDQKFEGPEASEKWRERKIRLGLDDRTLISMGEYVSKIKVFKIGKTYMAGVDPRAVHKESGLRIIHLAAILEYGAASNPPRPHHRLAREWIIEYMKKRYRKSYNG